MKFVSQWLSIRPCNSGAEFICCKMFEVTYICTIIKTTSVGDQLAGDTDGLAGDSGRGQSGRGQPDRSRR